MRSDLTDVTLVMDRSGSMHSIRADAEGGLNAFIATQVQQEGETLLTLVQFDTEYEFVHRGVPIGEVPPIELQPRGATALLDAIGRAITETGQRLAAMAEAARPGLVVVVVITDGLENSSREFTRDRVRTMIEHQQSVYDWKFTFLAADQDAFAEAAELGIDRSGVAAYSRETTERAFDVAADQLIRMQMQVAAGEPVCNDFTTEERDAMK